MIEFIFVCFAVIVLIMFLFYKHRRSELEIIQLENEQISDKLGEILEDLQPVVIRGTATPKGVTRESLQKIPRLSDFSVGGQPLAHILEHPEVALSAGGIPTIAQTGREELAKELAIHVWAEHTWLPILSASTWLGGILGCMRTEVIIGGLGMVRTTAKYTCIMPTEGTYTVSILAKASESFLPTTWQYKYVSSLTLNDTPLVSELKFLDIVLRPGTTLCLPPHCIVSVEPSTATQFYAFVKMEYHEPITLVAKSFSQN